MTVKLQKKEQNRGIQKVDHHYYLEKPCTAAHFVRTVGTQGEIQVEFKTDRWMDGWISGGGEKKEEEEA